MAKQVLLDKSFSRIVNSKDLKRLLLKRCDQLKITYRELCNYFGDDHEAFYKLYIRRKDPIISEYVNEAMLIRYFEFLGINITIVVKKDPPEKIRENIRIIEDNRLRKRNNEEIKTFTSKA